MQIDLDYYDKILSVFLGADEAHIDLELINNAGIDYMTDKFLFHFQLLAENRLISNAAGETGSINPLGFRVGAIGNVSSSTVLLRLTQNGHDFAKALHRSEVLDELNKNFKDAPFKTLFDVSQKLLEHFLKKKLDEVLAE